MSRELSEHFKTLRGQDYIDQMRALALLAKAQDGHVTCGVCKKGPALYIGMQDCGHPGPPICQTCLDHQRDWINACRGIEQAIPWCRHCKEDISEDHVYALSLYDPTAERINL